MQLIFHSHFCKSRWLRGEQELIDESEKSVSRCRFYHLSWRGGSLGKSRKWGVLCDPQTRGMHMDDPQFGKAVMGAS